MHGRSRRFSVLAELHQELASNQRFVIASIQQIDNNVGVVPVKLGGDIAESNRDDRRVNLTVTKIDLEFQIRNWLIRKLFHLKSTSSTPINLGAASLVPITIAAESFPADAD